MQQVTLKYVLFECLLLRVYRNSVVVRTPPLAGSRCFLWQETLITHIA